MLIVSPVLAYSSPYTYADEDDRKIIDNDWEMLVAACEAEGAWSSLTVYASPLPEEANPETHTEAFDSTLG